MARSSTSPYFALSVSSVGRSKPLIRSAGIMLRNIMDSTAGHCITFSTALKMLSGVEPATRSTGLPLFHQAGSSLSSSLIVVSGSATTLNPSSEQASAAITPQPPPAVTMPTPRPFGSGCRNRARPMFSISSRLPALITPACLHTALKILSEPEIAAVCEAAAFAPACVLPALTITIGFFLLTSDAILKKRRPSLNPSI